jgi:hypothetical protein
LLEKVIVVNSVECRRQIRVKDPLPLRVLPADGVEDGLDRVMAATTRPKPVGLRLEPRFAG